MSCIYYIWRTADKRGKSATKLAHAAEGYIGLDSSETYDRIKTHVIEGYNGVGYESERMIRQYGASGVLYAAFEKSESFGIKDLEQIRSLMTDKTNALGYWEINGSDLQLAELLHIIYHRAMGTNFSTANKLIGGQGIKMKFIPAKSLTKLGINFGQPERFDTIDVSQWNRATLYKKILHPISYRVASEFVKKYTQDIWQQHIKAIAALAIKNDRNGLKTLLQKLWKQNGQKQLDKYLHNFGFKNIQLKFNINPEKWAEKVAAFVFDDRMKRAMASKIQQSVKNPFDAAEWAHLVPELADLIGKKISGKNQGDWWDIDVKVEWLQDAITEEDPEWFKLLTNNLSTPTLQQYGLKAKEAAIQASIDFFSALYNKTKTKPINNAMQRATRISFNPNTDSLSTRMYKEYRKRLGQGAEILKYWDLFYADVMAYLPIPEDDRVRKISSDPLQYGRSNSKLYYDGDYARHIQESQARVRTPASGGGGNTLGALRRFNYF